MALHVILKVRISIELDKAERRIKMKNKQKEQACKELDQNELEKVTGGVFVPVKPDEDDDNEDTNNHGGGATGGW